MRWREGESWKERQGGSSWQSCLEGTTKSTPPETSFRFSLTQTASHEILNRWPRFSLVSGALSLAPGKYLLKTNSPFFFCTRRVLYRSRCRRLVPLQQLSIRVFGGA